MGLRVSALRCQFVPAAVAGSWVLVISLALVLSARSASAAAVPGAKRSVDDLIEPKPNATSGLMAEIKCYALPYGALGILSHILTTWTMAWISVGKIPLWPWHDINSYKVDLILAAITLVTTVPVAAVTINRCRLSWHFILIGVWKLITSVSLSCVTIHRALIIRRSGVQQKGRLGAQLINHPNHYPQTAYSPLGTPYASPNPGKQGLYTHGNNTSFFSSDTGASASPQHPKGNIGPLYWLILYLAGTIAGMVGLLALIYTSFRHNRDVRSLTYGFGLVLIILPITTAFYWYKKHLELLQRGTGALGQASLHTIGGALIAFAAVFGFFSALYSDLVLGAIAEKWSGAPTEDYAGLYWTWFIAKRTMLLSH